MKTFFLYLATAIAEIVGCYLPWLWLRQGSSAWLLLPAAASLAAFAWLLTLHPDGCTQPTAGSTSALLLPGFGLLMAYALIAFQPR